MYEAEAVFGMGNCYTYALDLPNLGYLNPGSLNRDPGRVDKDEIDLLYADFGAMTAEEYHLHYIPKREELCKGGARRDGLVELTGELKDIEIPRGYYLAAMFMKCCHRSRHDTPSSRVFDYHWYRQDADGMWSQKKSCSGPISNLDNSGHVIHDPRVADRGDYERFSGFFLVPRGIGR
jgi:hypothetical protein